MDNPYLNTPPTELARMIPKAKGDRLKLMEAAYKAWRTPGLDGFARAAMVRRIAERAAPWDGDVRITNVYPSSAQEWANLTVELVGDWKRTPTHSLEIELKDAILTKVMGLPEWNSWMGKAKTWRVMVYDLDDDDNNYRVGVPIPKEPRDFDHWEIQNGRAEFTMSERQDL